MKKTRNTPFETAFDDGNDPQGGVATPGVATPEGNPASSETNNDPKKSQDQKNKVFTQTEIDKIVKERLARETEKHRESQSELLNRLSDLEKRAQLTDAERSALTQRIEELRNESLSTEEKATREIKRLQEETQRLAKEKEREVNQWSSRYQEFRIDRELWDAANQNDSRTPSQLVSLLKPHTQIKEVVLDNGQGTGRYEVKTTITEFKEDGTPFQVERSPMEAVARLREMPEIWGNQFNSKALAGMDLMSGQNMPSTGGSGGLVLDKGFDAYMQSRDRNKGDLGIVERRRR